jgi:negative regulator of genetic competence, sporulation and motility
VKIGSTPQNIISFINPVYEKLLIGELWNIPNNKYPDYFYLGYQYNKFSSFINLSSSKNDSFDEDKNIFIGEETLYLYTNINDIKDNKLTSFSNFKFRF